MGSQENTLAKLRAGIAGVLILKLNEKALPDLPEEASESLKIIPVETVDDVLDEALTTSA